MNLNALTLNITRKSIYLSIVLFSIFVVLFPWSILAYWRFYNLLIPVHSYTLPFQLNSYNDRHDYKFEVPLAPDVRKHLRDVSDPDILYDVHVDLKLYCSKTNSRQASVLVGIMDFNIMDSNRKSYIVFECDPSSVHAANNRWVPFYLRNWLPPLLSSYDRSIRIRKHLGTVRSSVVAGTIAINGTMYAPSYDMGTIMDFDNSILHLNVKWKGIRYFMFHHYIFCFVLGVSLFWGVSSVVFGWLATVVWVSLRHVLNANSKSTSSGYFTPLKEPQDSALSSAYMKNMDKIKQHKNT